MNFQTAQSETTQTQTALTLFWWAMRAFLLGKESLGSQVFAQWFQSG